MTPIDPEILTLLDRLDDVVADDLETLHLELKPWTDPRDSKGEAICLAKNCGGLK